MNRRDIPNQLRKEMRAARAGGMAYDVIADMYGVGKGTAYRHCRDVEVPAYLAPKKGAPRKVEPARLAQLRAMGVTPTILAERFSVTYECIYQALKRAA